jgi:hypothetical protein
MLQPQCEAVMWFHYTIETARSQTHKTTYRSVIPEHRVQPLGPKQILGHKE